MTLRKRRTLLLICLLLFAVAAPSVSFYVRGYRLGAGFSFTKTGGVYAFSPESGTALYINGKFKKQTGILQNGVFTQNLKPGEYNILMAKEGYWPWQKTVEVKPELVSETRAMLVKKNLEGETLMRGPFKEIYYSSYQKIITLHEYDARKKSNKISFYFPEEKVFLNPASPAEAGLTQFKIFGDFFWNENGFVFQNEKRAVEIIFNESAKTFGASFYEKPLVETPEQFKIFPSADLKNFNFKSAKISPGKKEMVWVNEKNEIMFDLVKNTSQLPYFLFNEEKKEMPVKIFTSRFPVKQVDFYPGRRDVIIIAIRNGVYAMELDGRGGRMIQPIYKGKDPNFALMKGDKAVYILDEGNLSYIKF